MDSNVFIGASITVVLFIVTHGGATIWFASKVNTTLGFIENSIKNLGDALLRHEAERYTKSEAAKDFAMRDSQIAAIFRKLDDNH